MGNYIPKRDEWGRTQGILIIAETGVEYSDTNLPPVGRHWVLPELLFQRYSALFVLFEELYISTKDDRIHESTFIRRSTIKLTGINGEQGNCRPVSNFVGAKYASLRKGINILTEMIKVFIFISGTKSSIQTLRVEGMLHQ
jgi:hypothetical protein